MPKIGSVHWKKFEAFLLAYGCYLKREKGDHRVYWRDDLNRPIVVPCDKNLPPFIIQNNLRTLGISREEFVSFLEQNKKKK